MIKINLIMSMVIIVVMSTFSNAQNSFPTNGNVVIDGSTINMYKPSTTGGWARGIYYKDSNGIDVLGGIGLYGQGNNIKSIYLGHGVNPWSTSKGIHIIPNGDIGIGTYKPFEGLNNSGLHISKGNHSTILLGNPQDLGYGGVIQTTDNKHRIFIGANLYDDQSLSWSNFDTNKGAAGISIIADEGGWGTSIDFYTSQGGDLKKSLHIEGDGKVGVGTTNPDEKLTVKGKIHAEEIIVDLNVPAPDYVFSSDYSLPTLKEVESFILLNNHLPEVPSAKIFEKEGISLGEMNMLLLKKIEELTLYLIEVEKINEAQNQLLNQILKQNILLMKSLEKK